MKHKAFIYFLGKTLKILLDRYISKEENMLNKKKIIILIGIILLIAIGSYFIFFPKNTAKNLKIGNNTTSQEIVDYILNISSYEAQIEVEINSNKNTNKYIMKQKYIKPDMAMQEIIQPDNIKGIKIIKEKNQLKVENSNLNLSKIYENYEYIADNCLDLNSFIEEYKENEKAFYEENENQIIMKIESKNTNPYTKYKALTIDRRTGNPSKMEIKDTNKKTTLYIIYNEVKLNSIQENALAFYRIPMKKDV